MLPTRGGDWYDGGQYYLLYTHNFNSQISVPLASYLLQLFSENRPQRDITFGEVFGKFPPAKYLLENFRQYFDYPFEEIVWEYRPERLAAEIRKVMTPLMEQLSILLHAFDVDILMLAGRPTKLTALTDLFLKFFPVSPDRLIRLPQYEVGKWYPFSHGTGEITDQKTIVAVGAFIGYLASHGGISGFNLDLSHLATDMGTTANYIGKYIARTHRVNPTLLSPTQSTVSLPVRASVLDPVGIISAGLDFRSWRLEDFVVDGSIVLSLDGKMKKTVRLREVPLKDIVNALK